MAEERNRRTAHLDLTENELREVLQAGLFSRGIEGNVSDIRVRMVQSENDLFPVADGISCSMQLKPVWNKIADFLRDNPVIGDDPVTPDEFPALAPYITSKGTLRTTPADLTRESSALSGLDGFFAARMRRL